MVLGQLHSHSPGRLSDGMEYMYQSSVLDNIVLGSPESPAYELKRLSGNALFREFLDETELLETLLVLGRELARRTVRLLQDLRGDTFFFEASPIPEDQFDQYGELVERLENLAMEELSQRMRICCCGWLALYSGTAQDKALPVSGSENPSSAPALERFKQRHGAFSYRQVDYLYNNSILNNILFGRLRPIKAGAGAGPAAGCGYAEALLDEVLAMGVEFQVGSKGDRLSGGQRQKIALARAFLKNPHILIMDEATASLDNASQARIQQLLETEFRGRCTVVAVVHRLDTVAAYDQIAVMKAGKIVETGKYQELMARKGIFHGLVQGTRAPM
jgi:ABC-type lipoprotein export system ATPase subunit